MRFGSSQAGFEYPRMEVFFLLSWNGSPMQRSLTRLTYDEREFETARDARREGLEFARKWIEAIAGVFATEITGSDNRDAKRNHTV